MESTGNRQNSKRRSRFFNAHKLFGLSAISILVFSLLCGLGLKSACALDDETIYQFSESQLTSNNYNQLNPDIYQYGYNHWTLVWQDNRNGNWDIYMYSQKYLGDGYWDIQWDTQITSNSGNNLNPKIYDNTIVYQSDRSGNWDIYLGAFWYSVMGGGETPEPPITPSNAIGELQDIKRWISEIPAKDFAGVNTKVQESRKNVLLKQLDSAIVDIESASLAQNMKLRSKYLQSAIDQLNDMIPKLDGWSLRRLADVAGSGFSPDWITTASYYDQGIENVGDDLQTLLNGVI